MHVNDLPLLSIIVPVYNVEAYLSKCLDSLIFQTYTNLEIIVVNDGSTDSSLQICKEYAGKDSRIKLIDQQNGGLSYARNQGVRIATGEYIGFIDSDDWVEKDMYEILVQLIKKYNAEIAVSSFSEVKNGVVIPYHYTMEECTWDRNEALIKLNEEKIINSFSCTKLFLRRLFEDISFPETEKVYEDIVTIYRAFAKAKKVAYTPIPLFNYVIREGSLSHPANRKMETAYKHIRNYQHLTLFLLEEGITKKVYPKAVSRCIRVIKQMTLHKDSLESPEIIRKAISILDKYNKYPLTWKRLDLHFKKYLIVNHYFLYKRIVRFI